MSRMEGALKVQKKWKEEAKPFMTYLGGNSVDIWVCPWGLSLGILSHFSFYYEDFHPWCLASWEAKSSEKQVVKEDSDSSSYRIQTGFPRMGAVCERRKTKAGPRPPFSSPCLSRALRLAPGTCPGTGLAPVLPRGRAQGCTFTRVCAGGGLRWELSRASATNQSCRPITPLPFESGRALGVLL